MISRLNNCFLLVLLLAFTACPCSAWTTDHRLFKLRHGFPTTPRTSRYTDFGSVEPLRMISLPRQEKKKLNPKRWLRPLARFAGLFLVTALMSPQAAMASEVAAPLAASQSLASPLPAMVELRLCLRLLFASLLGAAVGQERSSTHKHSAGVRTMALVALGACAFTVCSQFGFNAVGKCDPSRMASNVASGVGFVGAGVITTTSANAKDSRQSIVHGLTTATAIWISAAIGVCCGVGMLIIASVATLTTISILRFGTVKKKVRGAAGASADNNRYQGEFHVRNPRPPSMPPPFSHKDLVSLTTSLEKLKKKEEEQDDDEWDSFSQTHEAEEEEDEEIIVSQQSSSGTVDVEEMLKDRDIAEFHGSGQAVLLEQAHVASLGKNLTELVTASPHQGQQHRNDTYHSVRASYSGSRLKNETLTP